MKMIRCRKRPSTDHHLYELHVPAAAFKEGEIDESAEAEWRGRKHKVPFVGRPCGCEFSMEASLLEECDDCLEIVGYEALAEQARSGLWKCARCGEGDLRELVVLHGENGEIVCLSCLTGTPWSELPGSTGGGYQ